MGWAGTLDECVDMQALQDEYEEMMVRSRGGGEEEKEGEAVEELSMERKMMDEGEEDMEGEEVKESDGSVVDRWESIDPDVSLGEEEEDEAEEEEVDKWTMLSSTGDEEGL